MYVLLSRTQARPGTTVKQEQEEIPCNHVQTFIYLSVLCGQGESNKHIFFGHHLWKPPKTRIGHIAFFTSLHGMLALLDRPEVASWKCSLYRPHKKREGPLARSDSNLAPLEILDKIRVRVMRYAGGGHSLLSVTHEHALLSVPCP